MEYTTHVEKLSGDRSSGSCAMLIGENGEKLVAVASGSSSGMEAWNPNDGTVKFLTTDFPIPTSFARMISIQSGHQLVLYIVGEIWKYFGSNNSWIKIGNMMQSRMSFLALPLKNFT